MTRSGEVLGRSVDVSLACFLANLEALHTAPALASVVVATRSVRCAVRASQMGCGASTANPGSKRRARGASIFEDGLPEKKASGSGSSSPLSARDGETAAERRARQHEREQARQAKPMVGGGFGADLIANKIDEQNAPGAKAAASKQTNYHVGAASPQKKPELVCFESSVDEEGGSG